MCVNRWPWGEWDHGRRFRLSLVICLTLLFGSYDTVLLAFCGAGDLIDPGGNTGMVKGGLPGHKREQYSILVYYA